MRIITNITVNTHSDHSDNNITTRDFNIEGTHRTQLLRFFTTEEYPMILDRIIAPPWNIELYKITLSSILLEKAGIDLEVCKRFSDALEDLATTRDDDTLTILHNIFDIPHHYAHLYLDVWRVYLNNSPPGTREIREATIREYAADAEHLEDRPDIIQMLQIFTDEVPIDGE